MAREYSQRKNTTKMSQHEENPKPKRRIFAPPAQPLEDTAARAIRELQERGEWRLEGKGRPLKELGDLSKAPAMSAKLHNDAHFNAPWQDVALEIDGGLKKAAARVLAAHRAYGESKRKARCDAQCEAAWRAALENFDAQLKALNSLILKYNLIIPPQVPQLHRVRLRREVELQKMGIDFTEADASKTE
jgi:hypothetical protein